MIHSDVPLEVPLPAIVRIQKDIRISLHSKWYVGELARFIPLNTSNRMIYRPSIPTEVIPVFQYELPGTILWAYADKAGTMWWLFPLPDKS
jgi:hypothetical protein